MLKWKPLNIITVNVISCEFEIIKSKLKFSAWLFLNKGGDGDEYEDGAPANKRPRRTQTQRTQKPAAAVSSVYKAVDSKDVEVVSDDLSGKVIVIEPR